MLAEAVGADEGFFDGVPLGAGALPAGPDTGLLDGPAAEVSSSKINESSESSPEPLPDPDLEPLLPFVVGLRVGVLPDEAVGADALPAGPDTGLLDGPAAEVSSSEDNESSSEPLPDPDLEPLLPFLVGLRVGVLPDEAVGADALPAGPDTGLLDGVLAFLSLFLSTSSVFSELSLASFSSLPDGDLLFVDDGATGLAAPFADGFTVFFFFLPPEPPFDTSSSEALSSLLGSDAVTGLVFGVFADDGATGLAAPFADGFTVFFFFLPPEPPPPELLLPLKSSSFPEAISSLFGSDAVTGLETFVCVCAGLVDGARTGPLDGIPFPAPLNLEPEFEFEFDSEV